MSRFAKHWALDESVIYLNHGAYGACPRDVLSYQQQLRDEMERQPTSFFEQRYYDLFDAARERLAEFVGCDAAGLVRVPNATCGVNTVLASLVLEPGDELLVTNHAYNACRNALDRSASLTGARVVVATIPFPIADRAELIECVLSRVTPRTVFALIDHITSSTALVLPVETLVQELERRGVAVLVDGAHAPGMVPLQIEALGATWYTGNLHKWICAPRGVGFLWARSERRAALRPLVVSHGANLPRDGRTRYHDEFDWTGTEDPTPFLSTPRALDLLAGMLEGGWDALRRHNRAMVLAGRQLLLDALALDTPAPAEMIGSIASIPLPELGSGLRYGADPLQQRLRSHDRIEVPLMNPPVSPTRILRISAQLYNAPEHYERLAQALRRELGRS